MKEFGPINQDRLTTQPDNPKLEIRRTIFMAEGTGNGPEQGQQSQQRSLPEHGGRANPRRFDPEKAARMQELMTSLNKPGENASLAEKRSFEMAQRAILENFGIAPIAGGSDEEPVNPAEQPAEDTMDLETAKRIVSGVGVNPDNLGDEATMRLAAELNRVAQEADHRASSSGRERGGSFRMYLEPKDIEMLEADAMGWLESKFDMIYQVAQQGTEINSPIVSHLQQIFTMAANYLTVYREDLNIEPKTIEEFNASFLDRLNLIFMRSAIDHRSIDSAKEMSARLQASGLLRAFSMEDGNVYRMYGRMGELLEDKRLAQEKLINELGKKGQTYKSIRTIERLTKQKHLSPEAVSKLEKALIVGQLTLAQKSKGDFGQAYDEAIRGGKTPGEAKLIVEKLIADRVKEVRAIELKAKQFHVTPEMVSNLQQNLINEQLNLARKRIGDYGMAYEQAITEGKSSDEADALVEAKIRRAVRVGYDALVVSQRAAIIVARGHALPIIHGDGDRFMSDPAALFNVYNYEDLLTSKFNIYNESDKEFLKQMKLFIARGKLGEARFNQLTEDERLDYGTRMFRDLSNVPDFFSSGWRIDGILRSVKQRLDDEGYSEREEDFGLFLRLRNNVKSEHTFEEKMKDGEAIWDKIAKIRPEEIVRLYRERAEGSPELEAQLENFFAGDAFNNFRIGENGEHLDAFKTYDKFKKEFGPLIHLLRQEGYKEFRALRIGAEVFNPNEEAIIAKYFDGDESKKIMLKNMFKQMSDVASGEDVKNQLVGNDKFEDIYARTLLVDDAFLDKLEKPPKDKGITPLSQVWTSEVGGDALVRNFNDTGHAILAHQAMLKFIKEVDGGEKGKHAITFAEETSQYNGQEARADCVRYTLGSFLGISAQGFWWDALGVSKLPFRKSMSEIEKIYGYAAKPLSMDARRVAVDKIRTYLISVGEDKTKVNRHLTELEHAIHVRGKDAARRRAASLFFFLLLAIAVEAQAVVDLKISK